MELVAKGSLISHWAQSGSQFVGNLPRSRFGSFSLVVCLAPAAPLPTGLALRVAPARRYGQLAVLVLVHVSTNPTHIDDGPARYTYHMLWRADTWTLALWAGTNQAQSKGRVNSEAAEGACALLTVQLCLISPSRLSSHIELLHLGSLSGAPGRAHRG